MGKIVATVQVNDNEIYLVQVEDKYCIYWGQAKQEGKASIEILTHKGKQPSFNRVMKEFLAAADAAQYLKFERL